MQRKAKVSLKKTKKLVNDTDFVKINFWDSTYVLVSIILIVYQHTRIYSLWCD